MQTLYLIRHTTPRIAPGICYGQLDIDVADSFDEEANNVLHWLPPLELIIASPLLRTRRLAEFLAQAQHCELRSDARLMEKHFGAWEGKAWDDIARSEIDAWAADVMGYAPPGGESAQQVMQRVQSFHARRGATAATRHRAGRARRQHPRDAGADCRGAAGRIRWTGRWNMGR